MLFVLEFFLNMFVDFEKWSIIKFFVDWELKLLYVNFLYVVGEGVYVYNILEVSDDIWIKMVC